MKKKRPSCNDVIAGQQCFHDSDVSSFSQQPPFSLIRCWAVLNFFPVSVKRGYDKVSTDKTFQADMSQKRSPYSHRNGPATSSSLE